MGDTMPVGTGALDCMPATRARPGANFAEALGGGCVRYFRQPTSICYLRRFAARQSPQGIKHQR